MMGISEVNQKKELAHRVTSIFVQTQNVDRAYEAIEVCREHRRYAEPEVARIHQCILGEGGVGKTRMLRRYCMREDNRRREITDKEGNVITSTPVLFVDTPSPFTIGGLNQRILEAMGAPIISRETIEEAKRRAINLMQDNGVEVLILDEVQSIGYSKSVNPRDGMENLKDISNKSNVSLILCGKPDFADKISMDMQYARRYPVLMIEPYHACDKDFISLLREIEEQIAAPFPLMFSQVKSGIPQLLFDICEGYLGLLIPLIQGIFYQIGISNNAVKLSDMKVTVDAIERAYQNRGITLESPEGTKAS